MIISENRVPPPAQLTEGVLFGIMREGPGYAAQA
jgi:hypothetical protein